VIRGSAVNNDGFSNGLTAPNPRAQENVLREAYARAGVETGRVHYVEAHGTGTILGDPIEAKALGAVLGGERRGDQPLFLGSVKTNIGHLEAAAGIAGLIKVALAIKHRAIPPSLHFQTPNPHIPFEALGLKVARTLAPWPAGDEPALAGVSSFGFGGTNCHVVLAEQRLPPAYLMPLSADTAEELRATAAEMAGRLRSSHALPDLCRTAMEKSGRAHRLALAGPSSSELAEQLEGFLQGDVKPGISIGHAHRERQPRPVFVFSGHGGQWLGMGRELMQQETAFRAALERCERTLSTFVDWPLFEELTADAAHSRLDRIDVAQPTLFAIQVAVAELWQSWGIEPAAVVGHSMGEAAAAYVAGALSLEDAARIICRRSQLLRRNSGQGAMAIVDLAMDDAQAALAGYEGSVAIAASNSPESTVLAGDPGALKEVIRTLERRDISCRWVNVDVA
jgi:acyl transferase domain-containing protein